MVAVREVTVEALTSHAGSLVVIDSGAQWLEAVGAARTTKGQRVVVIDPFGMRADLGLPGETGIFDPVDFVRIDSRRDADLDVVLEALGAGDLVERWRMPVEWLLRGLIAHASDSGGALSRVHRLMEEATITPEVARDREEIWAGQWKVFDKAIGALNAMSNPAAREAAARLSLYEGTAGCGTIFSTARHLLRWLEVPELAATVGRSTVSLDEVIDGGADLFVCVSPDRVFRARRLMRLIASLALSAAMRRRPKAPPLFILGDAPQIVPLPAAAAMVRSDGAHGSVLLFNEGGDDDDCSAPGGGGQVCSDLAYDAWVSEHVRPYADEVRVTGLGRPARAWVSG